MKVLVFGASGGVGQHLVRLAVERGHSVTAVARSAMAVPSGVRLVSGEVSDARFVSSVVRGHDTVLSALGIRRSSQSNPWAPLASPADLTSSTARHIVAAMTEHQVKRVIAVSAAGVGNSRPGLNWLMRFFVAYTNVGANYRDLEVMEQVYAASGLDWCCVRPTGLKEGSVTGRVGCIDSFPFNAWISRADVAAWMVGQLATVTGTLRTPIITEVRA